MGAWGYYDDENDNTLDNWFEIENMVIPKELKNAKDIIENIDENLFNIIIEKFILNNEDLLYEALIKLINIWNKKKKDKVEPESDIVGILLYSIKKLFNLSTPNIFSAIRNKKKNINNIQIPSKLPRSFPEILRKHGENAILAMLEKIDLNLLGWDNIENKELALNQELYLFTEGRKGIKPTIDANRAKLKKKIEIIKI